ncbi:MAG: hypothetical protein CL931_14575 [Deltaproteobacteria bacterium]|nr:hypothetical protein [Deltaproteobacteria bacterium]
MGARFHGRSANAREAGQSIRGGLAPAVASGFGEWWGGIAAVALVTVAVVLLTGSRSGLPVAAKVDPSPRMLAAIEPSERALQEVERAFASLCTEPVLLAIELEPNCETGVITLSDEFFDGFGSVTLGPEAQEDLLAAMRVYLARLRELPAIWNSLEAIELRGHADPRAVRTPYVTNLVGSQQRPLGVLLFLVGEGGLGETDRADLERLAVVSGVSFSRPPETCPERSRECYPEWRRVEVRPVLSESLRRGDWSRTLEDVRISARQLAAELVEPAP